MGDAVRAVVKLSTGKFRESSFWHVAKLVQTIFELLFEIRGRPKALLGAVATMPTNRVHRDISAPSLLCRTPVALVKGRLKVFEVPYYGDKASQCIRAAQLLEWDGFSGCKK